MIAIMREYRLQPAHVAYLYLYKVLSCIDYDIVIDGFGKGVAYILRIIGAICFFYSMDVHF